MKFRELNTNGDETGNKQIILPINPEILSSIKNW